MPPEMTRTSGVLLVLLVGLLSCVGVSKEATAAPDDAGRVLILRTATGEQKGNDPGSMWRYFETWRTDVARVDGRLVNVDLFRNRDRKDKNAPWHLNEADRVVGSPFPADRWHALDFYDRDWIRHPGPFYAPYRRLALICLRGRFEVTDPAKAGDLTLTLKFQGGAAAYVNGQEVGRAFMPEGPISNTTPARDYPIETYVMADGKPLPELTNAPLRVKLMTTPVANVRNPWNWNDDKLNRFKKRGRIAEFKIPASALRKGVNVLAVEVHRAPADPVMFLSQDLKLGTGRPVGDHCWNRASIEEVALTAAAPAKGVVPNVRHPEGARIWAENTLAPMSDCRRFGDPNEPVFPVRILGMRNGTCAGVAVVSSPSTLRRVKASIGDLKMGPNVIPASAIRITWPGIGFAADALKPTAPDEVAPRVVRGRPDENANQPIWVIVKVPRDAAPGVYHATLSATVTDAKPMSVPVELNVVGEWVVPHPHDFVTFVGVHESPDSVAMHYKVPLWSDAHFKHLDRVYELLAQIGTRDIYLPILAKTHLGNVQSMVRWVPQPGGGYKYDFTVFERYLDTALKHLGKVPVVCLYLHDYGFRSESHADRVVAPCVTQMDPKTGKLSDLAQPEWGTPEARAFWKPVIDKARELLKKRGVEKSMMFGMGANNWVKQECLEDLKTLYPKVLWVNRTHYYAPKAGRGKVRQAFGLISNVSGAAGVSYDPNLWEKHCGWRSRRPIINFPRNFVTLRRYPAPYRFFAEGTLLSGTMGWRGGPAGRGLGHIGADFWPVMKGKRGKLRTLVGRYVFWHSLSIDSVITSILAPSPDGPSDTTRHQLMREALQEAEASIFVREALLDEEKRVKLGAELEARCRAICLARTWTLWYSSHFASYGPVFNQRQWENTSEKLYTAAAEVARALGK